MDLWICGFVNGVLLGARVMMMVVKGEEDAFLSLAEALDLADLLGRDIQTGLGAELSSALETDNDRVRDVHIASDIDLDKQEVDGELLDLDVNGGLDLGRKGGSNLVRDLDRGLGCQLDGILDNVVSLELDTGSIVLGAALGDEGSKVGAQVGRELSLDLNIDFVADSGLDRGLEGGGELGTETEIDVDKTAGRERERRKESKQKRLSKQELSFCGASHAPFFPIGERLRRALSESTRGQTPTGESDKV